MEYFNITLDYKCKHRWTDNNVAQQVSTLSQQLYVLAKIIVHVFDSLDVIHLLRFANKMYLSMFRADHKTVYHLSMWVLWVTTFGSSLQQPSASFRISSFVANCINLASYRYLTKHNSCNNTTLGDILSKLIFFDKFQHSSQVFRYFLQPLFTLQRDMFSVAALMASYVYIVYPHYHSAFVQVVF